MYRALWRYLNEAGIFKWDSSTFLDVSGAEHDRESDFSVSLSGAVAAPLMITCEPSLACRTCRGKKALLRLVRKTLQSACVEIQLPSTKVGVSGLGDGSHPAQRAQLGAGP
jgi:hypothetical protein